MLPPSLSSPSVHHWVARRNNVRQKNAIQAQKSTFHGEIRNTWSAHFGPYKKRMHEVCGCSKTQDVAISQTGCRVPRCRQWSTREMTCWRSHTRPQCGTHPAPNCRNLDSTGRIPPEPSPCHRLVRPCGRQRFRCDHRRTTWLGWIPSRG